MTYLTEKLLKKTIHCIKKTYKIIISLLILIIIVQKINIGEIYSSLVLVKPLYLLVSLSLIPIFELVRCTKWQIIINKLGHNISKKTLLKYNLKSYPFNVVTPSNIGDFIRVYYLHKKNIPKEESIVSVISDRLFDIISTIILAFFGFLLLPIVTSNVVKIILLISLILLFLTSIYMTKILTFPLTIIINILAKLFNNNFITKYELNRSLEMFSEIFMNRTSFTTGLSIGLIQWVITLIQFKIILLSFGYDLYLYNIAAVVSISWIAALVPITISGLGVREGVGVFLFNLIGVPGNIAFITFILTIILYQIILSITGLILQIQNE